MEQIETTSFLEICILLLLASVGATISQRPDYDRTAQLMTQTTGQALVYHPAGRADRGVVPLIFPWTAVGMLP